MSSIPVLGREVTVEVGGKSWRICRMTVDVLDRFVDWVRSQMPQVEPFAGFDKIIPHLPKEDALKLIKDEQARRDSFLVMDFNSPLVEQQLHTGRGMMRLLLLMLQVHQPETTLEEAKEVFEFLGPERLIEIFKQSRGEARPGKAQAPAGNHSRPTGAMSAGV